MTSKNIAKMTLAAGAVAMVADKAVAKMDSAAVDTALKTLKTYDWGADRKALNPIDEAIIATHGDAAARKALAWWTHWPAASHDPHRTMSAAG